MKSILTEEEVERVRKAVVAAEERTAGEIVPYIIPRSSRYELVVWRCAAAVAMAVLGVAVLVFQFYQGWGLGWLYTGQNVALLALVAGSVGALLGAYVPAIQRLMAGPAYLDRSVHHRAMRAFVEEEVFNTRDRTGILLFVSLLEHRIEVLGDEGINRQVTPDDWIEVVTKIRNGIKSGKLADGLVDAIVLCGALLERSGVEIRPDDTNELPNRIRIAPDDR